MPVQSTEGLGGGKPILQGRRDTTPIAIRRRQVIKQEVVSNPFLVLGVPTTNQWRLDQAHIVPRVVVDFGSSKSRSQANLQSQCVRGPVGECHDYWMLV